MDMRATPLLLCLGVVEDSPLHVVIHPLEEKQDKGKKSERLTIYLSHPKETLIRLLKEAVQLLDLP